MLAGRNTWDTEDIPATARRIVGFQRAAREAGVGTDAAVIYAGWHIRDGVAHARRLLDLPEPERPTGFVCARDRVAVGVALAAAQLGLRVPEDLSVVGYDNEREVAEMMVPPLTTVNLPHRTIGATAMDLLLRTVIDGEPMPAADVMIPCELVMRESVGPAPRLVG
jgi:LacI family transcriptional regulator